MVNLTDYIIINKSETVDFQNNNVSIANLQKLVKQVIKKSYNLLKIILKTKLITFSKWYYFNYYMTI